MSYTEAQRRLREGSEKSRCRMTVVSFVPSSSTMTRCSVLLSDSSSQSSRSPARRGAIWGDLGSSGELWGGMGRHGEAWGRYGEIWGGPGEI